MILPASDPKKVKEQIEEVIGIDTSDAILVSAKTGEGIKDVLESICNILPAPKKVEDDRLKALLIDSWYDTYLGVIALVRIMSGSVKKRSKNKNAFNK